MAENIVEKIDSLYKTVHSLCHNAQKIGETDMNIKIRDLLFNKYPNDIEPKVFNDLCRDIRQLI